LVTGPGKPLLTNPVSLRLGWKCHLQPRRNRMSISRRLGWAAVAASAAILGLVGAGAGLPAQAASAPARTVHPDVGHQAAGTPPAGPFAPGNLLDYAESDFEGSAGTGGWVGVSNATLSQSTTQAYLHDDSLEDTIGAAGTSVYKVGGDTEIPVNGNQKDDTYTVGGYFEVPAASGRTVTWKLGFYNSDNVWLGWGTTSISLNSSGTWQYAGGQIQAPSGATYVLDSPEVSYSGASASEVIYMDEVAFSPYRAAQMIGAYAGGASGWLSANSTSEIGPLQSNKEFYDTTLPANFNQTVCYQIEQGDPTPPACVITYKTQATQAEIDSFVDSIPSDQMVIMVFCQEPEGTNSSTCFGTQPQSGALFVHEFEEQSDEIRAAGDFPNVLVAMDAEDDQYDVGGAHDNGGSYPNCYYIPPPAYVDVYLVDHYENDTTAADNGGNMANSGGASETEWDTWLGCVSGYGKPIGLAEYGLNQDLDTTANPDDVYQSLGADNTYLEQLPASLNEPVLLWENWWYGGDQFTDAPTEAEWQSFETQNGGT
jgi:hypothetical protein